MTTRHASADAGLQVGIYCRVSHDPSGRGTSVADQEKEGRRWCEANGHEVAWVVVDNDLSASRHARKERPGFAQVQNRLAGSSPVDVLWTWEASRAQRDMSVYVEMRSLCERLGVHWSYHGRTYDLSRTDDRFTTGMDALLAERYADETRDRVLRAVRSRVETGKPHGRVPYGYRIVRDPVTGITVRWEPDPEAAPIVKEIARRVLAAESRTEIVRDLTRRGVPSPHVLRLRRQGRDESAGRGWELDMIAHIATRPTYAGLREYKGSIVEAEATWEPLISLDDHRALKKALTRDVGAKAREREIRHLLTGIVLCGVCGATCRRVANRKTPSYVCWKGRTERGYCVSRRQDLVDAFVEGALLRRLKEPDALEVFESDRDDGVTEARRELANLEARLEEFRAAAEMPDGLPVVTLARMEIKYGALIEEARKRAFPSRAPQIIKDLIEAEDIHERWSSFSANQRRQVVKIMMTVTILPVLDHGSHIFDPSRINIEWRWKNSAGSGPSTSR